MHMHDAGLRIGGRRRNIARLSRQIPHLRTESLSMFSQLMNFLKAPETAKPADLKIAVAVLLLEAAYRDDSFSSEERAVIARLLRDRFGLSQEEASQLMAATESKVRQMVQLQPYTHAIFEQMPPQERVGFIEMLWEVAYADGVLDPEEDALIRRLGGLIYVTDRDRVLARHRVLERLKRASQ